MKSDSVLRSTIAFTSSVFVVLLLTGAAFAQQGTSSVRGVVTDPQGHIVTGATVTLVSPGTSVSRTTTTSEAGTYSFDAVTPGDYRLEVEGKGFKKAVTTDIHALVAKATPVDVQLEVGNVSETVTVASGTAELLVNRDDATLGNNFINQQITQLPISARNVITLLTLQPGVTRGGYVTGARSDQSNVTLDGVDINESQTGSIGTTQDNPTTSQDPRNNTVLRLNPEAIEEFRVTTSNANATQGHSSGAQVSVVSKSGNNEWHGSATEFYRSKGLAANDFFNNRAGRYVATDAQVLAGSARVGDPRVPTPQLIRHSFNGTVSGPIIKDKFFFLYSFDGRRQLSQSSVVRTVPLPSMGLGQLRYCNAAPCTSATITTLSTAQLNTAFPVVGMNPAAIAVFAQAAAKYPANDFTTGDSQAAAQLNTAGFRFNAPTPVQLNQHWGTFNYNINRNQQLAVRTVIQYDKTTLTPQFPDTARPGVWSHPWGIAVSHTWTLNNQMVNTFHYGYTREAFTVQGDSSVNAISFRFVFSPVGFSRTLARETPVQNFNDDFDNAIANPSFYSGGAGNSLSNPIKAFAAANGLPGISGSVAAVQNAVSALIGRFSQYTANFTFGHDGGLLSPGTATNRNFATEEYDAYVQDVWKYRPNLTFTLGLRYSLERPVYERQGFEMRSNIDLADYFAKRLAGAQTGVPFNDPITFNLSGPANNAPPLYNWDKNNFQPSLAVAWSPRFRSGFLSKIFGSHEESVIRGGFRITNDQYGEQLAVNFDLANAVGFVSNFTTSANTFCTGSASCAAPLFTAFGQAVRPLPKVIVPAKLTFPSQQPADGSRRIETSFDAKLVAPINYSWNLTLERQLPKGLVIQAAYVGRHANHLIATRDVMALNNLVDPKSGMDWYTAAGILERLRAAGTPVSAIQQMPYFVNLFPANLAQLLNVNYWGCPKSDPQCLVTGNQTISHGYNTTQAVYAMAFEQYDNDWTDTQDGLDDAVGKNLFFNPQYGALSSYGSIAKSWYHAGTLSIRQRLGRGLTWDFNYTLSHSLDDASGLQTSGGYGAAFILNPIRQRQSYASSDFDVRHIIPIKSITACPDRGGLLSPKLFGCNPKGIYDSFRNALPGEAGSRNIFRLPGYIALDMGIAKEFRLPWSEKQKLQLRFEAFNVTNTQRMGTLDGSRTGFGIAIDPFNGATPPTNWSNFTGIQGQPREMQFGFRYTF